MNQPQPDARRASEDRAANEALDWGGKPLHSTLRFLSFPALLGLGIIAFELRLPGWALYGFGGLLGLALFAHTIRDPEWLLALLIIYLPLNKMFVVPIAPSVNGTNALLILLLFAYFRHGRSDKLRRVPTPASSLVLAYAAVTLMSTVTAMVTLGVDFVMGQTAEIKQALDQFIVFFTFARLIRDGNMARRVTVYMMIGGVIVLALGFQEWLDKRYLSSIEKSRLLGPHLQPNDFGAFLASASTIFLALLLCNLRRIRVLAVALAYLSVMARVLLSTFSRGAYLGMGLAGVVAGYLRGKVFLIAAAALGFGLLVGMPELVPESLMARMGQTQAESSSGGELDTSSQTRIILWKAAWRMSLDSPVFGWGFKSFRMLKGNYTETPVEESDNHNMYLYLSSQMGIPAMVLLVLLFWRMHTLGVRIYRASTDRFVRAIGMGAASMAASLAVINMFGSRMVDICVTGYFWVTLAVLARLCMEIQEQNSVQRPQ